MYQCSKKLVTYEEYCCFDHSDFSTLSVFTFDVCWGSLDTSIFGNSSSAGINTYLSDYLFVSYDYGKKKYVRSNHSPFMNKNLSKAIMLKIKPRNIFLKNRTEENKSRYTKQRNLCVTLLRKSKRECFNNLNEKNVCDNKKILESS